MKAFASLLLVATAASANAQAASGMKSAKVEDVVGATRSCLRATGSGGVDEAALRADDWVAATLSAGGKTLSAPLRFYGRKDGNVLIMISDGKTSGLCTVVAQSSRPVGLAQIGSALTKSLGVVPAQRELAGATWIAGGKMVNLQTGGDTQKSMVRISVMNVSTK